MVVLDRVSDGSVKHIKWMGGGGTRRIELVGERRFPYCWLLDDCLSAVFGIKPRLAYRDILRGVDGQVLALRELVRGELTPIITQDGLHRVERRLGGPRLWRHACLVVSDPDGDIIVGNQENTALTIVRYVPSIELLLAMAWFIIDELRPD